MVDVYSKKIKTFIGFEMPKVFISHSWEDNEIARNLAQQLKQDGAEIWIDYARISGGDSLSDRISEALEWCDILILIWSKAASESYYVKLEWQSALDLQKKIIPCIVDDTNRPIILRSLVYIDFSVFENGYNKIKLAINNGARGTVQNGQLTFYDYEKILQEISRLNTEFARLKKIKADLVPITSINNNSTDNMSSDLSHLTNWKRLINQLNIDVNFDIEDATYFYNRGLSFGITSKWGKMVSCFYKSLSISNKFELQIRNELDKHWVANFNIGVKKVNSTNQLNADYANAINQFRICIIIDPTRSDAFRNLAITHLHANDLNTAKETYLKLIDLEPKNTIAMIEVSRLCMQMKDYKTAIAMSQKALELEPEKFDAVVNLAMAYDLNGDREKALAEYEKAIAKNPNDGDLLFNMARLYFNIGNYDHAVQMFQKVITQNPEDYDANVNVGNAYLNMAEEMRKKLVEKEKNKQTIDEAEMTKLKGFYKESIPYLEKSLSIKADKRTVWYNLGVAYVNIGIPEKGQQYFNKAESLHV